MFWILWKGTNSKVVPANNFYIEVKPEDAKEIVEIDIIGDKKVERILYKDPVSQEAILDYKKWTSIKTRKKSLKKLWSNRPRKYRWFFKKWWI